MATLHDRKVRLAKQRSCLTGINTLRYRVNHYMDELLAAVLMNPTYEVKGVFGYVTSTEDFVDEDTGEVIGIDRSIKVTRHGKLCKSNGRYLTQSDVMHPKFRPDCFWHTTIMQRF
jgi:hypothetical protein